MNKQKLDIDNAETTDIFKRLVRYFYPFKSRLLLALIATLFVSAADSAMMLGGGMLLNMLSGISHIVSTETSQPIRVTQDLAGHTLYDFTISSLDEIWTAILLLCGATIVLVIIKGVVHFMKEWTLWTVTNNILMKMKEQLFNRIVLLPQSTVEREKSGEMLSRITYDVTQMEKALRTGVLLVKSAVEAIVFVTMLFLLNWSLSLFAILVFPLAAMIIKYFGESIRRYSGAMSRNVADYTSFLSEAIAGSKVIKAFGREKHKQQMFGTKILENFRHSMKIARVDAIHSPIQEFISTTGLIAVILFCAWRLLEGAMNIGTMTAFIGLLQQAYKPIKKLGTGNTVIQRAIASGKQIFDLMDEPSEDVVVSSGKYKPSTVQGKLSFNNVNFAYLEKKYVLRDFNLEINAGETLALVGPSGGGKSTIVNLIPRFYPVTEGTIELDNHNTAEYDIEFLRSCISFVPQETILFTGTVEDNIRFSRPDATDEEVINAAKSANAHRFIKDLQDGYRTEVGERGVQLSGGQRQRVAIARAVLRDPRILLLDEATSALDSESEKLIQEALERIRQNRTTIIIAHRLSTIQSADRIAVIENGNLIELGSHQELNDVNGLYRRLYEMQFNT